MTNKVPKILFKYPSRGRPERFFDGMESIVNHIKDKENYWVVGTFDEDDVMKDDWVVSLMNRYKNFTPIYGKSKSKVDAINRDMPDIEYDWDIIICMSDDMRFSFTGFDYIVRAQFSDEDFDKLLHIPDNDAKSHLATMYIAGRKYYDRFKYIYNPEYSSLFCDNEAHEVAQKLGKYRYVDFPGIITHLNPAYGHLPKDEMFIRQQEIGWTKDQETYNRRRAENFGL